MNVELVSLSDSNTSLSQTVKESQTQKAMTNFKGILGDVREIAESDQTTPLSKDEPKKSIDTQASVSNHDWAHSISSLEQINEAAHKSLLSANRRKSVSVGLNDLIRHTDKTEHALLESLTSTRRLKTGHPIDGGQAHSSESATVAAVPITTEVIQSNNNFQATIRNHPLDLNSTDSTSTSETQADKTSLFLRSQRQHNASEIAHFNNKLTSQQTQRQSNQQFSFLNDQIQISTDSLFAFGTTVTEPFLPQNISQREKASSPLIQLPDNPSESEALNILASDRAVVLKNVRTEVAPVSHITQSEIVSPSSGQSNFSTSILSDLSTSRTANLRTAIEVSRNMVSVPQIPLIDHAAEKNSTIPTYSDFQDRDLQQLKPSIASFVQITKSQRDSPSPHAIFRHIDELSLTKMNKIDEESKSFVVTNEQINEKTDLTGSANQNMSLAANSLTSSFDTHLSAAPNDSGKPIITQESLEILSKQVLNAMNVSDQSTTLDLNLPNLGPLRIEIKVNRQLAEATFISNDPIIRQAIEAGLPQLRLLLQTSGIDLQQAHITDRAMQSAPNTSRDLKLSARLIPGDFLPFKLLSSESIKIGRTKAPKNFDNPFN